MPLFYANSPIRFVNGVHFADAFVEDDEEDEASALVVEDSAAVVGTGTAVTSALRGAPMDKVDSAWRINRGIAMMMMWRGSDSIGARR